MRICSLLPSATEILFALGLGDQLVAVTHECDYPPEALRLPSVTRSAIDYTGSSSLAIHSHISQALHQGSSIYHLEQELMVRLDPEIIITQELCQVCAVSYGDVQKAVRLLQGERKLLSLEPTSLGEIMESVQRVGELTGAIEQAAGLVRQLRERIDRVASAAQGAPASRVFAMEWLDPPFVGGHWVPEMLRLAGGIDGLGREGSPSFEVSWDEIAAYNPEVVVLMPCGFDLERTVDELRRTPLPQQWHRLDAVRSGRVYAVDGSAYFNRPGPRIVDGLEILAELLFQERFPRRKPPGAWRWLGGAE